MISQFKFVALGLLCLVGASQFPPAPNGLTTIQSKLDSGVTLSFKETNICETTAGVKSWAGYVHLPANVAEQRPFDVNTFFWFFEARSSPKSAPLSIWLQGGPGVPSISAALGENGPCIVNEDSATTSLNKWSWNNNVNMLYIDQPVNTGFSYNTLVNGTINQLDVIHGGAVNFTIQDFSTFPLPDATKNQTFFAGTFGSNDPKQTFNTSANAAIAAWHLLQTFTQEFPEYTPSDNKLSIWTESYGGHWGPTFAEYFSSQNDLIANGSLPSSATPLEIDHLGIINGCIDLPTQIAFYPQMAFNNTYNIQAINQSAFDAAVAAVPQCLELAKQCRQAVATQDPNNTGTNALTSKACAIANQECLHLVAGVNDTLPGRDVFDIGQAFTSSFPPKWAAGYLNGGEIQSALGVPLNFTGESIPVAKAFALTGDFARPGNLENLGKLLDRGVKISLIYGDRDWQCNWLGGENISLTIPSSQASSFKSAGYTQLQPNTNGTSDNMQAYIRQSGSLSFTRVFNAGHQVPFYKPELAYTLFNRAMSNQDLATGTISLSTTPDYTTTGPSNIFSIKNPPPGTNEPILAGTTPRTSSNMSSICYAWDVMQTCTVPQIVLMAQGKGVFEKFILVGYQGSNGTTVYYNGTTTSTMSSGTSTSTAVGGATGTSGATPVTHTGAGTSISSCELAFWMVLTGVVAWVW